VTVNVALIAFAATETVAGTLAEDGSLLLNATAIPLLGAGALRVTVAVDVVAPTTLVGFSESADTPGGSTVSAVV
jgi:hypothetical protein